ncbi:MAG: hypothetical protein RBR15_07335 [Sphaerochaeta sp.]|nr:hypothetical protein [Sphaerochaeta sp.]
MNKAWKKSLALVVVFAMVALASLGAALHTSVPIGHRAYRILDVAEIRGLIGRQTGARPFSADTVMTLLEEVQTRGAELTISEKDEIASLLKEFELSYGYADSTMADLFSTGFYRTYNPEKKLGASIGANLATEQTASLKTGEYDSRNTLQAFIKGDLGEHISFNMNFGLNMDKLDNRVFLPTEFTIPGEGFYMNLAKGGSQLREIPSAGFNTGLVLAPELGASFFGGDVRLRWGSIKRDWGPALNNLMVSGSARSIDGIELSLDLTSWLRYTVLTGSMGKVSLARLGGELFFSDDFQTDKPYYRFDNNLSAHRVELDATPNLTLAIFESVVWGKRFELGYLNPLTIYMFEQNNLGDIDNMLAGLDFNYTLGNKVRFYGSIATTEVNKIGSLKTMITAPRNILAFQAGVTLPLPIGSFSSLTFQWTYLAPFFYSHYPLLEQVGTLAFDDSPPAIPADPADTVFTSKRGNTYTYDYSEDELTIRYNNGKTSETFTIGSDSRWVSKDGRIKIDKEGTTGFLIYETYNETAYVNKGENLGYPLNPNSQEFLLQLDLGFAQGWTGQAVAKYQVRSGQYGYSIEQFMHYGDADNYPLKAFWANTFEHALTLELHGAKKFVDMPIELNAKYRFTTIWERGIDTTNTTFDGRNTVYSAWKGAAYDHVLSIGAKIYF